MPQLLHRHTRTHISRRPIFVFLWLQGKWEPVRCLWVPALLCVQFVVFVELFVCTMGLCASVSKCLYICNNWCRRLLFVFVFMWKPWKSDLVPVINTHPVTFCHCSGKKGILSHFIWGSYFRNPWKCVLRRIEEVKVNHICHNYMMRVLCLIEVNNLKWFDLGSHILRAHLCAANYISGLYQYNATIVILTWQSHVFVFHRKYKHVFLLG